MTSRPATATAQFIPCSPKHKSCTKAHSDLVWGFRAERRRQELELEAITGGYQADKVDYFARGGRQLITFKQWLQAHKRTDEAVAAAEAVIVAAEQVVAEAVAAVAVEELSDTDFWAQLAQPSSSAAAAN